VNVGVAMPRSSEDGGVALTPWWRLCVMCMEDEVDSLVVC
jgi:hypothetical protein